MRLAIIALLALTTAGDSVRASVYTKVILPGGTIRLTCHVPKDADHRLLRMGIEGLRTSERELEGDRAAITHQMYIDHIPCGYDAAFCLVTGATGKPKQASDGFVIGGCESTTPD